MGEGFLLVGLVLAIALIGIALLVWDNKHGMRSGLDLAAPEGDVPTIPPDQLHRLHRARFERMDGVL